MKKIFISLAFLFTLFVINSCTEDPLIYLPEYNALLTKVVIKNTNFEGTDTSTLNFEYKDDLLVGANIIDKNFTTSIKYNYNDGLITNVKLENLQDGKFNNTNLSYEYQNGKLLQIIGEEGSRRIYQADYKYNGNMLSEVISRKFDGNLVVDSTFSSDFINGRPGLFKKYIKSNFEQLKLIRNQKFVYQNGNLIEQYSWNSEKNRWEIEIKRYFDNSKREAFYEIKEFWLTIQSIYPYIPNNYNNNLFTKEEFFNSSCDSINTGEQVLYELTNYTNKYNMKGLLEEINSQDVVFCGQRNIYTSVYNLTWEEKPYK